MIIGLYFVFGSKPELGKQNLSWRNDFIWAYTTEKNAIDAIKGFSDGNYYVVVSLIDNEDIIKGFSNCMTGGTFSPQVELVRIVYQQEKL